MWNYEKRLQYPINIKTPNAKAALYIMSQNSITFENHNAYLLYQAALERNPDLPAHGSVSVQYALYLYNKAYPEERPKGYGYRQCASI